MHIINILFRSSPVTPLTWCGKLSWVAGAVEAEGAGAEIGEHQGAAEHGDVLEEIGHLHLAHHGIVDGPEVVHIKGNGNEEEDQEPGAGFGLIAEENAERAENAQDAGDGYSDGSERHASMGSIGAQGRSEVHGTKEQKHACEEDSSEQNDDFHPCASTKIIACRKEPNRAADSSELGCCGRKKLYRSRQSHAAGEFPASEDGAEVLKTKRDFSLRLPEQAGSK